ncbi:MAG: hypothetical protein JOY71_27640 [Acetobacteraceae bacterium]|nr:hypothetical protein [Acetobacteraceae bacterium]MBV8525841.1 hypothetical protein [Acetobacteraceae bacterium]
MQTTANRVVGQMAQLLGGAGEDNGGAATGSAGSTANRLAADVVRALQNYGGLSAQTSGTVSATA